MKKVAILTRTSTINFGTILQNYALQKVITGLGYDVLTVDDTVPRRLYSERKELSSSSFLQSIKEFVYSKFDHFKDIQKDKRYHKVLLICERFKKRHIKYYNVISLERLNNDFDIFLSGSDQIWSDKAEPELFPFFMQDFVTQDRIKASYAVSVGAYFKQCNAEKVRCYLKNLNSVSVREQSSYDIIREYYGGRIQINCDPVLLLKRQDWEKLVGKRIIKTQYVFCYFLSDNEWYYNKIRDCLTDLEINDVFLYENTNSTYLDCHKILTCSPDEFLNYILFADFIITDSFHALLFSIIFNKQLNVFRRYEDEVNIHQNGRIEQIMANTGISDWYLDSQKPINTKKIDYSTINQIILNLKDESESELRKTFEL